MKEDMKDLDAYPDVTELLPDALAAVSPHRLPDGLRARVLRTAEVRAGRSAGRIEMPLALRGLGVAVILVLIVGLLSWNLQLQLALAQEQSLLQQFRDKAAQQPVVFDVVDSPTSVKINLAATGPQRRDERPPYGKLYANPAFTQVVVMAGRLPDPASSDEYHLYVVSSGNSGFVGALPVDGSGFGYLVFDAGVRGPTFSAVRLYLQPKSSTAASGVLALQWESR
jgi:hypothetical protein